MNGATTRNSPVTEKQPLLQENHESKTAVTDTINFPTDKTDKTNFSTEATKLAVANKSHPDKSKVPSKTANIEIYLSPENSKRKRMTGRRKVLEEVLSLLYWTMLAACTVGPGTVVTCARAGAEFNLNLIWALIFASVLAYTLQEGTARLTINSGKSLGQCLQVKYRHGRLIWHVGVICWVVAVSVFLGNTLFSCNNWAGGLSAIYSLPGAENTASLRIGACFVYGAIVFGILIADKGDSLGIGLGVVMIAMVILFLVVVIKLGMDWARFGRGLLPIAMPSGSANIVLSLVGTTAIGFNLFLGGKMAEGKTLAQAQRGIAFSTVMTFLVSVLIMVVGDGTTRNITPSGTGGASKVFTIASLGVTVEQLTGRLGLWIFGLGFIAAALSSMIVAPLGSVMTCESVFNIYGDKDGNIEKETVVVYKSSGDEKKETDNGKQYKETTSNKDDTKDDKECQLKISQGGESTERLFPKKYARLLCIIMVSVAVIVNSANAPPVKVILVAQVFNGCLLPLFSICLLICLNDRRFMKDAPQRGWSNVFLGAAVTISIFLTTNTMTQNLFGWLATDGHVTPDSFETGKLVMSGVMAAGIMLVLCVFTSLGRNIWNSLKCGGICRVNISGSTGEKDEPTMAHA